jgi:hypothetical protein
MGYPSDEKEYFGTVIDLFRKQLIFHVLYFEVLQAVMVPGGRCRKSGR